MAEGEFMSEISQKDAAFAISALQLLSGLNGNPSVGECVEEIAIKLREYESLRNAVDLLIGTVERCDQNRIMKK